MNIVTRMACAALLWLSAAMILVSCRGAQHMPVSCEGGIYFPQTGYKVQEPFCTYFRTYGGVESFGYPITSAFLRHGLMVQYFEKARMEYHPENPPRYRIQLGLLGEALGRREPPIPSSCVPLAFDRSRRYYPQTGHTLPQPFLAFYDAHGGVDRFGYPLSEPYCPRDTLVQDFQRARLILRGDEIDIADWGRVLMRRQPDGW